MLISTKARLIAIGAGWATLFSCLIPAQVVSRFAEMTVCGSSCTVSAAGWPFPFLVDSPDAPSGENMGLLDAWPRTIDDIWYGAMGATYLCWLCAVATVVWLASKRKARTS